MLLNEIKKTTIQGKKTHWFSFHSVCYISSLASLYCFIFSTSHHSLMMRMGTTEIRWKLPTGRYSSIQPHFSNAAMKMSVYLPYLLALHNVDRPDAMMWGRYNMGRVYFWFYINILGFYAVCLAQKNCLITAYLYSYMQRECYQFLPALFSAMHVCVCVLEVAFCLILSISLCSTLLTCNVHPS